MQQATYAEEKEIVIGSEVTTLERGEVLASERYLERRWNWSRGKVRRFLSACTDLERIRAQRQTAHGTIYLIARYGGFENARPTDDPNIEPATDQQRTKDKKERKKRPSDSKESEQTQDRERTALQLCQPHLWLAKKPPRGDWGNERDMFDKLTKEFGADEIVGIIPLARSAFNLGDQPASLRLLYSRANRPRVRELIHEFQRARIPENGRGEGEADLSELTREVRT